MDGEASAQEAPRAMLATWLNETGGPLLRFLGSGRRLELDVQRRMEAIFGRDFSQVRIHDTRQAGEMARRLQAEAFTIGHQVFAAPERLAPTSPEGLALLGHELTHVVQQTKPGIIAPLQPQPTGYPALPRAWGLPSPAESAAIPEEPAETPLGAQLAETAPSEEPGSPETQALQVEQATRQIVEEERARPESVSPEELAERIYRLMQDDLRLERERKAF